MLQRFRIADDFRDAFRRDGVVVLTDLFSAAEAAAVLHDVLRLFELRFGGPAGSGLDLVLRNYASGTVAWRQCARRMQHSLAAAKMSCKPELVANLEELGLAEPMLATFPEMRVDMPNDDHYMQPWHQDWNWGHGSRNAVTFWTALHDVSAAQGAIEVLPGSHRWGVLPMREFRDPRRFAIDDPRLREIVAETAELKCGECVLLSDLVVHRSGRNRSAVPRFSCQLRFCDRAEPTFVASGYRVSGGPPPREPGRSYAEGTPQLAPAREPAG